MSYRLSCTVCNGPINDGEPVSFGAKGIQHKFRTTCDWHIEDAIENGAVPEEEHERNLQ